VDKISQAIKKADCPLKGKISGRRSVAGKPLPTLFPL